MTASSLIDEQLFNAQLAINNALGQPDILADLSRFGYDEAKINAGKDLLTQAEILVEQQRVEYGEQYQISEDLNQAYQAADEAYRMTLKIARVAFKGNIKAGQSMDLNGRRKQSMDGWAKQTQTFYNNLLAEPDFIVRMGNFGYDQSKLESERDAVVQVVQLKDQQEVEKGEAQQLTKNRDVALDALDEWLSDFKEVAEVALIAAPQRLEMLGFGVIA
ncbi:MAG: hypothetical protein KDI79_11615 [Anaerolineae bacterium]|nr:hypothetical protein [Anaerolineae bacterium]